MNMIDDCPRTPPNRRSSKFTYDLLAGSGKFSQPLDDFNKRKSITKDILTKVTGKNVSKDDPIMRLIKDSSHVQEDCSSIKFSLCSDMKNVNERISNEQFPFLNDINMDIQFTDCQKLSSSDLYSHNLARLRYNSVQYTIKKDNKQDKKSKLTRGSLQLKHEVDMFSEIGDHVNIVKYITSWIQEDKFHVLLEYVPGGSLEDLFSINRKMTNISINTTLRLTGHITSALRYLETLSISHGNIKFSNILVTINPSKNEDVSQNIVYDDFEQDNSTRLIFKLSNFTKTVKHRSLKSNLAQRHLRDDIFDIGVVLCRCLGQNLSSEKIQNLKLGKRIKWDSKINRWWRNFIGNMLTKDWTQRPSLSEITSSKKIKQFILPESLRYLDDSV